MKSFERCGLFFLAVILRSSSSEVKKQLKEIKLSERTDILDRFQSGRQLRGAARSRISTQDSVTVAEARTASL